MKIKRIHTSVALMSRGHKFSFDDSQHLIEFHQFSGMISIDKTTLIPLSNIREMIIEEEIDSMPINSREFVPLGDLVDNISLKGKKQSKKVNL